MPEVWSEITTYWKGDMVFIGENAAGDKVQMGTFNDQPGVGPMQLLLVALSGCTGQDIVAILEKKRYKVTDFQMKVRAKRAETYPMVYTEIHVTFLIWGEGIKPKDVEEAIRLSEEKYCSVGIMLGKSAPIHSTYQILKPGETAK